MKLNKDKKAYTIGDIPWIAITFGVGIIVLSIIADIVQDVQDTFDYSVEGNASRNVTTKGLEGVQKIGNWLPTIGLVLGAVIVIVALSVLFVFKGRR